MRLSSIKLAGFKSFADPVQFALPGQMIGVVGPNGCGKSNIVDAVRWVLGESRASQLRGESMQDVIFNGSHTRKPASRASVELMFDNSAQRASGQWGQYAEIAVKRVSTRDGGSYFINNQAVRRRDVQDLFLGTGLGPRAYAMIGQGTISRLVESRPEELRLFLEEAAGVSKYKERRRESENRLRDTRENLIRVQDLLGELEAQLEKLERQATLARRYQRLQQQHSEIQQQWWWLKQQQAQTNLEHIQAQALAAHNHLESGIAALRDQEAQLETLYQAHHAAGDTVNTAQGKVYEANAALTKLEAELHFIAQNRERISTRLQQIEENQTQWQQRLQTSANESAALQTEKQGLQAQLEAQTAQCEQASATLPDYEAQKVQAQQLAEQARERVHSVQQQIQVLSTEQRHAQEQLHTLTQRLHHLQQEQGTLQMVDIALIEAKQGLLKTCIEELGKGAAQTEALTSALAECETQRSTNTHALKAEEDKLTQLRARVAALTALQEKVQTDGKRQPWLDKHGLAQLQTLWTKLHVARGWESALEAALRERLQALQVGSLQSVGALQLDTPPVKLGFYSTEGCLANSDLPLDTSDLTAAWDGKSTLANDTGLKPLLQHVHCKDESLMAVLHHWLVHCLCAETLEQALAVRHTLHPGQIIFVAQGHAVTRTSLDFYAADSAQAGVLARAQELEVLQEDIHTQALQVEACRKQVQISDSEYARLRSELTKWQSHLQTRERERHALEMEILRLQQALEQYRARQSQLQQDSTDLQASIQKWEERVAQSQVRFEVLDQTLAEVQETYSAHEDQVLNAGQQLEKARNTQRALEQQLQETHFEQRNLNARESTLQDLMETARQQRLELQAEAERLQGELVQADANAAHTGLQETLEYKNTCEQALRKVRNDYEALSVDLRKAQEQRLAKEQALEPLRTKITEHQLQEQAERIAVAQNQQALHAANADLEAVAALAQASTFSVAQLPAEMERLQRALNTLGAVNLAALDELSATRERQGFLQAQMDDLTQAMQTLEEAIRKIDAQTSALLSSTFESVNQHFGSLFPALFGGGQAQLVMTGATILEAGVQVVARPPGKKNQTIHLLSGGEKALTAIALVFAIFQLNPAPFCLLDEVDAPLDDANVERYAKLVQRMSKETQFLLISHNKITMQAAQQLVGVTMQEQGVSRVVAVDLRAAVTLSDG